MMNFTQALREGLEHATSKVCLQKRMGKRLVEHALAYAKLSCSRTISNVLCSSGRDQLDWSAEYKAFSRSEWSVEKMFDVPLEYCIENSSGPLAIAVDDTKVRKSGRKIPGVTYQKDPMSPPFHPNIITASRFLQASAMVNSAKEPGTRALPVSFREAPVLKKPGKNASPEQVKQWKERKKTENLPCMAVQLFRALRSRVDGLGAAGRRILLTLDGGFCNKGVFSTLIDRVDLLARCRKDARLCLPSSLPGCVYDAEKFTPESVRKDEAIAWTRVRVYYGGDWREVRCKQVTGILWQGGAKRTPLRLVVLSPQPYRTSPNSRVNYRSEAYYLSTDLETPLPILVQAALDRWQIEVNHREEKTGFGTGEAQVRSRKSVPRHPAFAVLVYSLMHMCALALYGPNRPQQCMPLPKWRKRARRPSIADLRNLLINEAQNARQSPRLPEKNQAFALTPL